MAAIITYESPEQVFGKAVMQLIQMDEGNLPQPKKRELAESILAVSFKAGEEERNMTKKIKTFLCAAKIIKASKELGFLSAEESSNFFANFQQSLGAATQKLTDGSNESILHVSEMLKILCEVHPDNAITLFHKEIERTVAAAANTIFPLEDKSHPAKFITSIFFEAMKTGDRGENFVARNLVSFLAIGNCMKTFRSFPDQEIRTIINILKRVHHNKKFNDRALRDIRSWANEFSGGTQFETVQEAAKDLIKSTLPSTDQ